MTPYEPLTMDDLKGLLNSAKMVLYVGIGLLEELTPNAKITRMKIELAATGQAIDNWLKIENEIQWRGACLGTQRKLKEARQLIIRQPYPARLKDGRKGWLDACENMANQLGRAEYK